MRRLGPDVDEAVGLAAIVLAAAAATIVTAMLTMSCKPERPACQPQRLAEIEAAYVAEAVAACRDAGTLEACAELPEIEARYAQKREEWIQCR